VRPAYLQPAIASAFSAASINLATTTSVGPGSSGPAVLRLEILLDRAHFSCGQIDGRYGQNLKNAIEAYQLANQLTVDGVVGRPCGSSSIRTRPMR
jgi:peptidoglycan hydrolase-like protein with peptidoglycan-binding domain